MMDYSHQSNNNPLSSPFLSDAAPSSPINIAHNPNQHQQHQPEPGFDSYPDFNAPASPQPPFTPSYGGSFNNSPYGSDASFGGRDEFNNAGKYFEEDEGLYNLSADNRLIGGVGVDDEYNPNDYDAPNDQGLMFENDFLTTMNDTNAVSVSVTPAMDAFSPHSHSFDHGSPASSNGNDSGNGHSNGGGNNQSRSRASSVGSYHSHHASPHASPRLGAAVAGDFASNFESSLTFNTPSPAPAVISHWRSGSVDPQSQVQSPPPTKPQSPPQLFIPSSGPEIVHHGSSPSPDHLKPKMQHNNTLGLSADSAGGLGPSGPGIHIVPATPVSGGGGITQPVPFQKTLETLQQGAAQQSWSSREQRQQATADGSGSSTSQPHGLESLSMPRPTAFTFPPQPPAHQQQQQQPPPSDPSSLGNLKREPSDVSDPGSVFNTLHNRNNNLEALSLASTQQPLRPFQFGGLQQHQQHQQQQPQSFLIPQSSPRVRSKSDTSSAARPNIYMSGPVLTQQSIGIEVVEDSNNFNAPNAVNNHNFNSLLQNQLYTFPDNNQGNNFLSPAMMPGGPLDSIRRSKSEHSSPVMGHRRAAYSEDLRMTNPMFAGDSLFPPNPHTDLLLRQGGVMGGAAGGLHRRSNSSGGVNRARAGSTSRERSGHFSHASSPYPSPHASPRLNANDVLPSVTVQMPQQHQHQQQQPINPLNVPVHVMHVDAANNTMTSTVQPPIVVARQNVTTHATADASHRRRRTEANFVCPVPGCGSTFTRHFNLKGHMRSHNEERPFKCKWPGCDKGFARQHDCKRHEQLHLNVRPYVCQGCKRNFARMDALNRHLRSEAGTDCQSRQPILTPDNNNIPGVDLNGFKIEQDGGWNGGVTM